MDSIAITKPNMVTLSQDRPGLSSFGVLSQAFSQELLARAGFQEGRWPFVALDLLEEGEEAPASPPPVQPVAQVDLRLVLQSIRQLDMRTEKAVERVVERIVRLREQGRPYPAPVQPTARGDNRKGAAGQTNQTAGPEATGEGRAQGRVRGVPRQAVSGPGPGGGKHAAQTSEPVVSTAGSFARLQNFYNTIHQHLQFIANIRESGIWRPDSPTSPQRTPNGLDRRSAELIRRAYGLRREQGRMSVPAVVSVGIPSLAGAAGSLTAGNPSGLPRYDTARREEYLTARELACLEDGTGSAVRNGSADAAAESRGLRRKAGQLKRAIDAQALSPDVWVPLFFARMLHPDAREPIRSAQMVHPNAWESMCSVRTLHPDARGSMRSIRTPHPDAWGSMRSLQTPHSAARQPVPSARTIRRNAWGAMPGLDLWKQGTGSLSGQGREAGWLPQSIPQRFWGVERPRPGSGKAVLAPPGSISTIETAAFADRARWGKNLWSVSRQSAVSDRPGIEGQGAAVPRRDAPVPIPLMGEELAHGMEPEGESLPRQGASQTEPAGRGALGERTMSTAAVQSAPVLHDRAAPGLGGVTAQEAGPVGANSAARGVQPVDDPGGLPSVPLEEVRQSSSAVGTWSRAEKQEKPVLPSFSEMPGEELAHRAASIGPEWGLKSGPSTGRAQTSADRTRTATDKAQASAGRTHTSTSKVQASTGRTQTSTDRMQTSIGGAQVSSDIPARLLEAAGTAQHRQTPQADPAAVQPKPPVSDLRDIRTIRTEQSAAGPGKAPPQGRFQAGALLPAPVVPGAELIHSADLYRGSVPVLEEAGARAPAGLTAQAKGHRPQADSQKGKTRRDKPAAQTGGRGTQSGTPWGQIRIGAAAGAIEQAEEIAALRYVPLVVNQMQGLLTGSLRDIRPFAAGRAGRAGLTAGLKAPQEGQFAAPYHEILPPGEMTYGVESKDMTGADVEALREGRAVEPYYEILPPGEMIYGVQSKDTAGAGVEVPLEGRAAAPYREILPPGEMIHSVRSKDTARAGVETLQEGRSTAPRHEIVPPGEMIYGVQNQDMAGAGKDARRPAAPSPLELTYGGTVQPSAAESPAPAAGGQKPVQSSMESDYVRELPDWARRFLREGAPQTREEAVRRLDTGRERTMGTAQNIAALPSFSEEAGTAFQWTAPDTRAPAPVEYREPRRQQELSQPQSIRISEAEVQRTADRVYRIIEDRIRRERWRLGL